MATRPQFSREFKLEAVRLVAKQGVALAKAARDLDLHEAALRSWIRELVTDPLQAFPGKGVMKPEPAELVWLRKEVAKLKMECDIPRQRRCTKTLIAVKPTPRRVHAGGSSTAVTLLSAIEVASA